MKADNLTKTFVPSGDATKDIREREKIISEVYRKWYDNNPTKSVFNHNLNDYINIRFVSINETIHHASRSFLSTLAVLQIDLILRSGREASEAKSGKQKSRRLFGDHNHGMPTNRYRDGETDCWRKKENRNENPVLYYCNWNIEKPSEL